MATGKKVPCTVSITDKLLAEVDAYAATLGETRSVVIQRAIRELLARVKKAK